MNNDYLYDPKTGAELLTTEQAAEYLGYNYASVRHIVSDGGLKPYTQAGKTLLFRIADLRDYKLSRKGTETDEIRAKLDSLPAQMTASIEVGNSLNVHKYDLGTFTWADIPKIRANMKAKHGKDQPMSIKVKSPDGCYWKIDYEPETWLDRAFKKRGAKK